MAPHGIGAGQVDAAWPARPFLYAERVIADPPLKPRDERRAPYFASQSSHRIARHGPGRFVTLLLLSCGVSSGMCAGLSLAAFGLAVAGRTLLDVSPARIQVFLVVGPLLGLLPVAILCLAASGSPDVARRT
ncbi:MAG TPA: hypothetical protein VGW38_22755, partial [Chloroflexota bacterium]|nr:hypothetical protein [Chloroflexota bacterium]